MSGTTRTPWEVEPIHYTDGKGTKTLSGYYIRSAARSAICRVDGVDDDARGDADLIVRAVNCHEELLSALKAVEWKGEYQTWPCCPSCGAPAADVVVSPDEAKADARPGEHMGTCILARALATAEGR